MKSKYNGGEQYYVTKFQRIYDNFVFSIKCYGYDKQYARLCYREALEKAVDLQKEAIRYNEYPFFVSSLRVKVERLMKKQYELFFSEKML